MNLVSFVLSVWLGWDWRRPVRLAVWALIATALARRAHIDLLSIGVTLGASFLLLSVLTFGLLTPLLLPLAEGAVCLALVMESAAFAFSEGCVLGTIALAPRVASFFAALGVEVALVLGAGSALRAAHAGERLWTALSVVLR